MHVYYSLITVFPNQNTVVITGFLQYNELCNNFIEHWKGYGYKDETRLDLTGKETD